MFRRKNVVAPRASTTLKMEIVDALRSQGPLTCYELEDFLKSPHQSVSGTITGLVKNGILAIEPYKRINKFGNQVRVYSSQE